MQNKLQELTDKLYNEGLSKGKQEGEELLAKAKAQVDDMLAKAQAEAAQIIAAAQKQAEEIKTKTASDIKMASSQSIAATKKDIESLIVGKMTGDAVKKTLSSADFIKDLIKAVAEKFTTDGPVDLEVILPESLKDVESFLTKELAKTLGVKHTVNTAKTDLKEYMEKIGIREGFDVGLEMSGAPSAFNQMLDNMIWGGKVSMLGLFGNDVAIDWNKIIMSGLTVQGIYGRKMYQTWYQMKNMVQGGLDMSGVITHRFHYTEFEKGFEAMISGKSGKVVLDWTKK